MGFSNLINILANDFLNIKKTLFGIVCDVFVGVGKVYELLLDFIENTSTFNTISGFISITETIYILAGIFMLFRVTISFINLLIDPDKINDKQVGAGGLLKRVFIAILLLIVLKPNSFIFNYLSKIESAILSEDGLLNNITAEIGTSSNNSLLDLGLIQNVDAANPASFSCYYYHVSSTGFDVYLGHGDGSTNAKNYTYDYYVKLNFSTSNLTGYNSLKNLLGNETGWYVNSYGGTEKDSSNNTWTFKNLGSNFKIYAPLTNSLLSKKTCPKSLVISSNYVKLINNTGDFYLTTLNTLATDIGTAMGNNSTTGSVNYISENSDAVNEAAEKAGNTDGRLSGTSLSFAQGLLKCFIDKLGAYDESSNEKLDNLLKNENSNIAVYELATANVAQISISYFLALIAGIVIMIYLLILVVDVVVRNLKLLLLQIIAPIPIISYIDPKDKIFSAWVKMYLSTYADLFIKLFALSLSVSLLNKILVMGSLEGLKKLLFLLAILIFAKALPSLINKLFGIDVGAGSFKDIGKMLKTAAGVGVGAAIGGAAALGSGVMAFGASKGQGFGNRLLAAGSGLKNVASGAVRGAVGGAKGKVTGGLSAANANMKNRASYSNGISAGAMVAGGMLGGIGMDYASRTDRQLATEEDRQKRLENGTKGKSNMDSKWDSSDYYKSLSGLVDGQGNQLLNGEELKTAKKLWMKTQMGGGMPNPNDYNSKESNLMTKLGANANTSKYTTIELEGGKRDALNTELESFRGTYAGDSDLQEAYHTQLYREKLGLAPNENFSIQEMQSRLGAADVQRIESKYAAGITNYEDVSTAEAGMNHAAGLIRSEISRIKGTGKYREAAAVRDSRKNK